MKKMQISENFENKVKLEFKLPYHQCIKGCDDVNQKMVEVAALTDEERLIEVGFLMQYLVKNIDCKPPKNCDLFFLTLYPYRYPRISKRQEEKIKNHQDEGGQWLQEKEQLFFNKINKKQAKLIYEFVSIYVIRHPMVVNAEFDYALLGYWWT